MQKGGYACPAGVSISGSVSPAFKEILTHDAILFLAELHRKFNDQRLHLLAERTERQKHFDAGGVPDFLPETKWVRDAEWRCGPCPADLEDRRVEITGPPQRKMAINAVNSGAKVFMVDFEDSSSPTWHNVIDGQINCRDVHRGTIQFTNPKTGKQYQLVAEPKRAAMMARPRGWHLPEAHITCDGRPMSGSLVDFGLYAYWNAQTLIDQGKTPAFYLAKLESHREARLWNDVFIYTQSRLGVAHGTFRATCLIETILAAFEMDEILYELRHHSAGLNCGRWDYIFSVIKKFRNNKNFVLPHRAQVGMSAPFMSAYVKRLIKTCHRRGVHAMGGMAAQIPIKHDDKANAAAFDKVRKDKIAEFSAGHDGTWVAHPALIPLAIEIADQYMPSKNQMHKRCAADLVDVSAADLVELPSGTVSLAGIRDNINVSLGYIEAWLRGVGCVPWKHLMEDAATVEIGRSQIWQWIRHGVKLVSGETITKALVADSLQHELAELEKQVGKAAFAASKFNDAAELFRSLVLTDDFIDFLTIPAYPLICETSGRARL